MFFLAIMRTAMRLPTAEVIMPANSTLCLLFMLALSILPASAIGAKHACDKCGCQKSVKAQKRLVVVFEEVDMPVYGRTKAEVFCPDKGSVCIQQYRCDKVCKLQKSQSGKDGKSAGVPSCCCETRCGCFTSYGAKPTGQFVHTAVNRQVDVKPTLIRKVKWVTSHRCKGCQKK